jgi:DNA-binding NarL/FixJ family response regulator
MLAMNKKDRPQIDSISRIATNLKFLRQRLYDDVQLRRLLEDSIESLHQITAHGSLSHDLNTLTREYDLTNREAEVLGLLLGGHRPQIIAKQLHIALNTVRRHLSAIFRKLNVKSQLECIEKFAS